MNISMKNALAMSDAPELAFSDSMERELINNAINEERAMSLTGLIKAIATSVAAAGVMMYDMIKETEKAIDDTDSEGGFSW
ncbi:hypothetical protein [Advenella mimigardefordensis]|uniref:Uncharacterized protein n=1 Tax=Advenella mimigardefordensis (strain DSM 17166 / LMG 22922 / DPN7) TaxID=1247726 RepID=W0P7N1_ADVMD|nr:hypothetical protein [Advenella mimigardefordensis]AHG62859.1 hypothetical protein MIM_c07580 [Advenella mimigardefordensis DPN7]